ncbi:chemotaxis protein CheW [Calothrix sp. 336/3]|uniref:chemotaxis protein CheW n=1 Tax=Calothrix sp. 336/3 TaxID=1337936 RepID=UPI0004E41954|nr:chemotaxis protein CheW [Calothrix sp. 336/3]AKG20167.1 chemotaxis protein CheW [Calothrix sp. 336/3]
MAEQQICTFFLQGVYFGINVRHVQEVIRPQTITRIPLAPPDICGLINLRGQIITVIDLQRRLEMSQQQTQSNIKLVDEFQGFNLIVSFEDEVVSLFVDDVGDVLEFPQNKFQPPPTTLKGKIRWMLAGSYPLPDGFLLVLDPQKILNVNLINHVTE